MLIKCAEPSVFDRSFTDSWRVTPLSFPPQPHGKKEIQCQGFPPAFQGANPCAAGARLHIPAQLSGFQSGSAQSKTRWQPRTNVPVHHQPFLALTEHSLCPSTAPCLDFPTTVRPGCSSRVYYSCLGLFFFLTSFLFCFGFF